jgi:hypothetical protein
MKITFNSYGNYQIATADGPQSYEYQAGTTASVPEDVAAYFIGAGVAVPATAERATKSKGETATK